MEGQTVVEPCAFCGEPSVAERTVRPVKEEHRKGVKVIVEPALKAWVCAHHERAIEEGEGWQDRQAAIRKKCRDELKARQAEATLFDAGPPLKRGEAWR